MLTIRVFESRASELYAAQELPGFIHVSLGQEAVAAGVCSALAEGDVIATSHRGHGHTIAKGVDPVRMMAELFGKEDGFSGGVGGSMHIADLSKGVLGANGIVGAGIGIASGAALGFQVKNVPNVSVAFFGDGAASEGMFHEALNMAALWKLPVVYVCENNGFAEMTSEEVHRSLPGVARFAEAYGIRGVSLASDDVLLVREAAVEAVEQARQGAGPTLIEVRTNRWHGHFEGDAQRYRRPEELSEAQSRDPLKTLRAFMKKGFNVPDFWFEDIHKEIEEFVAVAVEAGRKASLLPFDATFDHVYANASRLVQR